MREENEPEIKGGKKWKSQGLRLIFFFFIPPRLLHFFSHLFFGGGWVEAAAGESTGNLKNEQRFEFMCCGSGDF